MKNLKFVVYREDKYYVSQCLNVDVSSFGDTIDEAIRNLREAIELYFEEGDADYHPIEEALLGGIHQGDQIWTTETESPLNQASEGVNPASVACA